jgi:hypothetical protein
MTALLIEFIGRWQEEASCHMHLVDRPHVFKFVQSQTALVKQGVVQNDGNVMQFSDLGGWIDLITSRRDRNVVEKWLVWQCGELPVAEPAPGTQTPPQAKFTFQALLIHRLHA